MKKKTLALALCMTMIVTAAPAGAQQLVPPPNPTDWIAQCLGVNALGEADHQVVPDINWGMDNLEGVTFDQDRKEAAYIKFVGTEEDGDGTVTWLYRVTGKNSEIECRSPVQECPDGPEYEVAMRYSDELLEAIENNVNPLPPPPLCE